jgi:hypothetical protein
VEDTAQDLNTQKETETLEKAGYTLRLNRQRKEKVYKDEIEIEENIAQSKKKVGRKSKKTKLDESEEEEMEEEEEEEEDNDETSGDEEDEEYEKKSRQKFNRNAKMKVDAVLKNFIISDTDSQHSSSKKSEYYLKKKKAKTSETAKKTKKTKRAIDEVEEESVVETTERAKNLRSRPSTSNKKAKIEEPVVEKTERAKSLRTRVTKITNSKYVDIESNEENE